MSGKLFNRGGLDAGLAEFLGLKGQLNASIESEIRPVIVVADLSSGPYSRHFVPVVATQSLAPSAAQFAYGGVRPGVGMALQILKCSVLSLEAAPGHTCSMHLMPPAAITAIAAGGTSSAAQMTRASHVWELASDVAVQFAGSQKLDIVSTVSRQDGTIDTFNAPASGAEKRIDIVFPEPGIILTRLSAAATGCLMVRSSSLDSDMIVTWYGREWPLPG